MRARDRFIRRQLLAPLLLAALVVSAVATGAPAALADGDGHGYDSIPKPLPGNLPSWGFEATQTAEFGNQITFAHPSHHQKFGHVEVIMSSWGCQEGHWYSGDCFTKDGAKFSLPITLNIYNPPPVPSNGLPGSLIATDTETFAIRFRPSADPDHCTGPNQGKWYDKSSKTCFNGFADEITFDLHPHVELPDSVVFGIAYNTSTAGYSPYGVTTACFVSSGGCPYDSLNIALSQDPNDLRAGSDPNPGTVFMNTSFGPNYCDGGAHGVGTFRLDSPPPPPPNNGCWGSGVDPYSPPFYIPAVRFKG